MRCWMRLRRCMRCCCWRLPRFFRWCWWWRRQIIDRGVSPYWSRTRISVGTTSNDPIAPNSTVESIARSTPEHKNIEAKRAYEGSQQLPSTKFYVDDVTWTQKTESVTNLCSNSNLWDNKKKTHIHRLQIRKRTFVGLRGLESLNLFVKDHSWPMVGGLESRWQRTEGACTPLTTVVARWMVALSTSRTEVSQLRAVWHGRQIRVDG